MHLISVEILGASAKQTVEITDCSFFMSKTESCDLGPI